MKIGTSQKTPGSKAAWLALLVIIVVAVAIVAAPVWIVQPFKAQTERGLAVAGARGYLVRATESFRVDVQSANPLISFSFSEPCLNNKS